MVSRNTLATCPGCILHYGPQEKLGQTSSVTSFHFAKMFLCEKGLASRMFTALFTGTRTEPVAMGQFPRCLLALPLEIKDQSPEEPD